MWATARRAGRPVASLLSVSCGIRFLAAGLLSAWPVFRLDEGAIFAWVFRYVFDRDQYLHIRPCMYSDVNVPPLAASFLYSSLWCFELSGLQGVSLVSGRLGDPVTQLEHVGKGV